MRELALLKKYKFFKNKKGICNYDHLIDNYCYYVLNILFVY